MTENIKRIGLFMIAAQTVIHFTAGRQYEKYMKIIAGVIVLLLFMRPFSSGPDLTGRWQEEMRDLTRQMERRGSAWQEELADFDRENRSRTERQVEEAIGEMLNQVSGMQEYTVTDVAVEWKQAGQGRVSEGYGAEIGRIRIWIRETGRRGAGPAQKEDGDPAIVEPIAVEPVITGSVRTEAETGQAPAAIQELGRAYAGILGVEEEKVEVIYDGGR